ncbi:MAG: hypothetical protein KDH92_03045 [Chloroflexi bacterium]|nr:hypothetical protein [Chloroflexota bacterium]
MRRSTAFLSLLVVCLVGAVGLSPALRAAPARQLFEARVFLPLGLRGVGADALPTPRRLLPPTATAAPSATRTLEPTSTRVPTQTPVPSVTPTAGAGGALVTGRLTTDGEPSLEGLGDGLGPGLLMRECFPDGRCEWIARTAIDADGAFGFRVPVPPPDGGFYQVVWLNEVAGSGSVFSGADLWMGAYYSPELRSLNEGDAVDLGRIEIADIVILSPTNGTGFQGLPWTFQWELRKAEMGDYRWAYCEAPCQTVAERERDTIFTSPSLGRTPEYVMNQHPPGTKIGIEFKYRWYIWVDYPNGGHGESYYARMLWWIPLLDAFADLGLVDRADWPGWQAPR